MGAIWKWLPEICDGCHQLILIWVTCWDHSKITQEVPRCPWKKGKNISANFLRNHTSGSLQWVGDPSPAQIALWNLKLTAWIRMSLHLCDLLYLFSFRYKQGHGCRTRVSQNGLPGSQHVRKAAVESQTASPETWDQGLSSRTDPTTLWLWYFTIQCVFFISWVG